MIVDRETCNKLIHLGRIQEKVKTDLHIVVEARNWLEEAYRIDNVISDQTIPWTEEERNLLQNVGDLLWRKKVLLKAFSEEHYEKMMGIVQEIADE